MVQPVCNNNNGQSLNKGENGNYMVKSGDTLWDISKQHGVSLNEVIKANPQIKNPDLIFPGQMVNIPGGGSRTGSLKGLPVSKGSSPSETPDFMTPVSEKMSKNVSLPSPYGNYQDEIMASSQKYNVPPEIITAVISRETNGRNIIGDGGHGHGLMQIDDRYHGSFLRNNHNGLDPATNIDYGTSIIRDNLNRYNGDFRKALAAYNAGQGNVDRAVANGLSPDAYTTGRNYGADVLQRAREFGRFFS
jgi:spore coat assembly protein SafA